MIPFWRFGVWRGRIPAVASFCALHTLLVAWVAWYIIEMHWSTAPVEASATPLPGVAFRAAWIAGALCLLVVAPGVGAGTAQGRWIGPDPTRTLPVSETGRAASAWIASCVMSGLIWAAPLPFYLALFGMGAFTVWDAAPPFTLQVAVVTVGPLFGVLFARWRSRKSWTAEAGHV